MTGLVADRDTTLQSRRHAADTGLTGAGGDRARRVVVIDPRHERRSLTSSLLAGTAEVEVVGEAATRSDALALVHELDADAVVVEIQMPVEEALRTITELRLRAPQLRIVVCSFRNDATTRSLAGGAGADGFFAKPINGRDLVRAVTAAPLPRP